MHLIDGHLSRVLILSFTSVMLFPRRTAFMETFRHIQIAKQSYFDTAQKIKQTKMIVARIICLLAMATLAFSHAGHSPLTMDDPPIVAVPLPSNLFTHGNKGQDHVSSAPSERIDLSPAPSQPFVIDF